MSFLFLSLSCSCSVLPIKNTEESAFKNLSRLVGQIQNKPPGKYLILLKLTGRPPTALKIRFSGHSTSSLVLALIPRLTLSTGTEPQRRSSYSFGKQLLQPLPQQGGQKVWATDLDVPLKFLSGLGWFMLNPSFHLPWRCGLSFHFLFLLPSCKFFKAW